MTSAGGTPSRSLPFSTLDPLFFDARRSAASGIEQPDARPNELLEVLVARDDDDVQPGLDALFGERADHVVGFIALLM